MAKKNYDVISPKAIKFAKELRKGGIPRIDAYSYTDVHFKYVPGSTASHFGKIGAYVTNKKKKVKK